MSCIVLVWGICRLIKLVRLSSSLIANKITISLHIFSYLTNIIVNALPYLFINRGLGAYEILCICNLVVYSVCTLIFGVIVNIIVTKIVKAKISESDTIANVLTNLYTTSHLPREDLSPSSAQESQFLNDVDTVDSD